MTKGEVDDRIENVLKETKSFLKKFENEISKMKKGIEEALKNAPPEEGTKNYNM